MLLLMLNLLMHEFLTSHDVQKIIKNLKPDLCIASLSSHV